MRMCNKKTENSARVDKEEDFERRGEELMFGDTDRFLEEVILSRRPAPTNEKQTKNDFLPKKTNN